MRRYEFLDQPVTRCVHFVRTREFSKFLESDVETARRKGVKFSYWNYLNGGRESASVASPLATALGLEHAPYGHLPSLQHAPYGNLLWVKFLDDLITLAYRYDGLVIVIDRADLLVTEKCDEMFNCLEAFLVQFHHWYDQKKPCHLCFQMVEDDYVTNLFTREAGEGAFP